MALKIAAIADTHYSASEASPINKRRSDMADILLLRTVHRLNRFIKPDVTVILGDLVDSGDPEDQKRINEIIGLIESRVIIIPGNHDGDLEDFYRIYPCPDDVIDIKDVRLITFIDPEEPDYNARRSQGDLKRMEQARAGWNGPIVSIQHVPLFPPGASASPYGYTNADEVWSAFDKNGFTLAISGHWHAGDDLVDRGAGKSVIVPALCESPFPFYEITVDGEKVETRRHELAMAGELNLIDYHVHTPFAYCQENMDMAKSIMLAGEMGLAGLSLTEHSGQLYYDRDTFWSAVFMHRGIRTCQGIDNRMHSYLEQAEGFCPPAFLGLEIDCDYSGNPVVHPDDFARAQVHVGAVHWLEELMKPEPDLRLASEEMLGRLSVFLKSGVQILAHPFRVFKRFRSGVPDDLLPRMIDLLREHGVAAEINFHTQETQPEFVKACVESGVKLVFGSDSHNLYEVGEFYPHLELIRRCGYSASDFPEMLADIRMEEPML